MKSKMKLSKQAKSLHTQCKCLQETINTRLEEISSLQSEVSELYTEKQKISDQLISIIEKDLEPKFELGTIVNLTSYPNFQFKIKSYEFEEDDIGYDSLSENDFDPYLYFLELSENLKRKLSKEEEDELNDIFDEPYNSSDLELVTEERQKRLTKQEINKLEKRITELKKKL